MRKETTCQLKLHLPERAEATSVLEVESNQLKENMATLEKKSSENQLSASEKREEVLVLSAEVTSLKEQICRYSEDEVLKRQEMSVLETKHNGALEILTSVLNQLAGVTTTASQKDAELLLLQNELQQQESLREKAQELETAKREELERELERQRILTPRASKTEAWSRSFRVTIKTLKVPQGVS